MFMLRKICTCLKVRQFPTLSLKINYENSNICYSTKNLKRSHLGSPSFTNVVQSPYYVDKTLFIEEILDCGSEHILITAPRRFNKSVNINMLKCFLESKKYKFLFSKLKIGKKPAMNQCGAHPVVYLDLKEGAATISSFEDAIQAMKISLQNAYLRHPYLTTSPMLSTEDKKLLALWNPVNFPSLDIAHVEVGLLSLCRLVSKHFSKKCFLLVDEYDAICTSAFSVVNADVLNNIIDFYVGIVGSVVKLNHDYIERSVLTGITRIMSAGLSFAMNNIVPFPFMEKEKFIDYYGILDWEFSELLSRNCNSSIHHVEQEAFDYYNGYTAFGRKILNTWSVMNFLEEGILQPYWVLSGV